MALITGLMRGLVQFQVRFLVKIVIPFWICMQERDGRQIWPVLQDMGDKFVESCHACKGGMRDKFWESCHDCKGGVRDKSVESCHECKGVFQQVYSLLSSLRGSVAHHDAYHHGSSPW